VLVDGYAGDSTALRWVGADGRAAVIQAGAERDLAIGLLRRKYAP